MLIATSLGAVAFVASLATAPITAALPPVVVTVDVAADVPPMVVSIVLNEATEIWRPAGLSFIWRRTARPDASAIADPTSPCPALPIGLRVVIGDERGSSPPERTPLGWIVFGPDDVPAHEIYVSHRNAVDFLAGARGVVPPVAQMPLAERNLKLGRAMGRALAHEMGHYLLASKVHARRGLMQATHTASAFFDNDRSSFAIDYALRQELAARLRHEPLAAVVQPGT